MNSDRKSGLRRMVKPVKSRFRKLACAATEKWISAGRSYDILVLFGMRRSGNHLAINWILEQVPGSAVFYNNIHQNAHPFDVGMREYRFRLPNRAPKIILSYEDLTVEDIAKGPLPGFLAERVARHAARVQCAVILRDPYNLFASRLKKWPERFASDSAIQNQHAMYAAHANYALAPKSGFGDEPVVPILYNRLVSSPEYRRDLARKLAINPGDEGLNDVPVYGHGSSFDGYQTGGDSVRQGVFDRWRNSMSDPVFKQVVADTRLQDLAREIFGMDAPE